MAKYILVFKSATKPNLPLNQGRKKNNNQKYLQASQLCDIIAETQIFTHLPKFTPAFFTAQSNFTLVQSLISPPLCDLPLSLPCMVDF